MEQEMEQLYNDSLNARELLFRDEITYSKALEIVTRYTDYANKKAIEIGKRFNIKPKKIDPRGFLR
jgi:hypothetical protein